MEENKRAAGRLNEIRQRRIRNRRMIVGISFVVFAFCIVMGIQMVQKNSNLKKLKEQESKLAQQYQQELQEMARKLGLLYPDEVIFKPED